MMNNYKIENEQKMSGMECVTDSNCAIMGGASLVGDCEKKSVNKILL